MIKLTEQQLDIVERATACIQKRGVAYLAMEMRTGKTLTALSIAERLAKSNVLFVTKKKAQASIIADYNKLGASYDLTVINDSYQRIEQTEGDFDFIIIDEAHGYGAFPKASQRTLSMRAKVGRKDLLLLSGTPSPETFGSQLFWQFNLTERNPFGDYSSNRTAFYRWAKEYVNIKHKYINGIQHLDYSDARREDIIQRVGSLFFTLTQSDAGIRSEIEEHVLHVPTPDGIRQLVKVLRKHKYYKFKKSGEEIVCDTAVKEMQKIHQICSGTVRTESGDYIELDDFKARFIKEHFANKHVAVFYMYKKEGELLNEIHNKVTESPEIFQSDRSTMFVCQVTKGSMGIDLSSADALIFFNIHFSSVQYWQARARLCNYKRRASCPIYWIFSSGGIEDKIYKAVLNKKDYTTIFYRKYGREEDTAADITVFAESR